jgi:hypothetical protein
MTLLVDRVDKVMAKNIGKMKTRAQSVQMVGEGLIMNMQIARSNHLWHD